MLVPAAGGFAAGLGLWGLSRWWRDRREPELQQRAPEEATEPREPEDADLGPSRDPARNEHHAAIRRMFQDVARELEILTGVAWEDVATLDRYERRLRACLEDPPRALSSFLDVCRVAKFAPGIPDRELRNQAQRTYRDLASEIQRRRRGSTRSRFQLDASTTSEPSSEQVFRVETAKGT